MKLLIFDIYLFLDALSMLYLSRPLESLARLGQKVTHWQWCLAGVLLCLSVIQLFFPVLINSSFEMHILTLEIFAGMRVFTFVIAAICINAYTRRDFPLKERAIAHHGKKKIFEPILLWQWILPLVAVADCLPLAFWLTAQLSPLFLKMSFSSHDAVCFSGESASCWEGWNLICV